MKYTGIIVIGLVILISSESFAQKAMTRSLRQSSTVVESNVKVGAFGEVLEVEETSRTIERHFDLADDANVIEKEATSKEASVESIMNIMVINERSLNQAPPVSEVFSFHSAKIMTNESGFYIELIESDKILDKEHKIYQEFGNLRVNSTLDGDFCYLIGNFASKETVDKFLNDIILPRYPNAKVVSFENGKQIH